jgi:Tfp pilus assembly protein PilE
MAQSRRNPSESGFTPIEVPVVIPTTGILATIALPIFLSQRTSGYAAAPTTTTAAMPAPGTN